MDDQNREFFIDCDGTDIHAKLDFPAVQKEKMPVLVIIPGFTGHIEETHIIDAAKTGLELGYVTLRAEMYGHGKSEGEFFNHNVMLWMMEAARVVRFASKLSFAEDVYLCGHSQGGLTVMLAAGIMNDVVKALIPLSPAVNIYEDSVRGSMLGIEFDRDSIPEYIECPDWKLSGDYVRVARMLPLNEAIESYKGPVFIIHGTGDETVPYSGSERIAAKYANARLIPVEGDNHCFDYHRDEMTGCLREVLRGLIDGI